MQILKKLKDKKKIINYVIPIICLPFLAYLMKNTLEFIFQIGLYFGTFIRAIFEIIIKSV